MSQKNYQILEKTGANYVPLSPLSFLTRTANIFGSQVGVIYQDKKYSWSEVYKRSVRLASALHKKGIGIGDTVSIISPNTPAMVEAHFGIPMCGAVINTINMRLDKSTVAYILKHSDCKLLLVDSQFAELAKEAIALSNQEMETGDHGLNFPVVRIDDLEVENPSSWGDTDYESFLATGDPNYNWQMPKDEWQALSLNYTSGTSGKPKGGVYHHRGSYLMSLGTVTAWQLPMHPVYLYTVPMFHCNGWGHVWSVCLMAGTLICSRVVSAKVIFDAAADYSITHFGGAPIVLGLLVNAAETEKRTFPQKVKAMTAGAPPPPAILRGMAKLGFDVMQVYGLTETYGHITHCLWKEKWNDLNEDEKAEIKSWQGISFPMIEEVSLMDTKTRKLIPTDSNALGEIVIRGNTIMKGYYKDSETTKQAFAEGWFHSGDIAAWQKDKYIQVKDRLKDVIISGGENISSVEIESHLYNHPAILHAAVVAQADEKWGEVPCAFVELKPDKQVSKDELTKFCCEKLAGFKIPKNFIFCEIPKTATGKIQKFALRQYLKDK